MSPWEIGTLALLALLIFGPDKLPQMARTTAQTIGRVRREARETLDDLRKASEIDQLRRDAGIDELRDAAQELQGDVDDARQELDRAALTGSDTGSSRSRVPDDEPPPYDPDAT
ncbi:twin-arginine translocase TatA/TatE family subunit [Egibacter rhizosphaerae]|uniref:Twin-arginine translocase TatA/TatE family subunit n=1 Tax=Egibacter rhizosphaerae TaxID=1670831 RepID=A0A411YJ42_9ACTN|nr:twin-arginine translocase TatA/TatE family subunit [Egibacter rhizosphaerae]QBI21217.1 twin-arginine translocase TatA/TatE family subunit [Egibacter rhizosphaerae]